MPKTMREQLEESFDQSEAGRSEEDTEESLGDTEAEEDEHSNPDTSEDAPEDIGDDVSDEEGVDEGEDDESVHPEGKKSEDAEDAEETEEGSDLRAPVSWKPEVREHWKGLPKGVKQEILRREQDIQTGMQQASGFRKLAQEYASTVRPFEQLIRAQNSTPAQAITNLMQTASRLTLGTPTQKAQVITEIIQNYAVDIETLDSVLAGVELPGTDNDPLLQQIDQRLQPISQFMSQFQQAEQEQTGVITQEALTELQQFAQQPEHEFYEDVRNDMADILELAVQRGRKVTLQEAYQQACHFNPEIKKVLDFREAKKRAARPSGEDLGRKKRAASSVSGRAPAGRLGQGGGSLRDTIASAFEDGDV